MRSLPVPRGARLGARVLALLLAPAACGDGAADAEPDGGDAARPAQGDTGAPPARSDAPDNAEQDLATLADGTHAVYGLRMPGGTRPVPGPHKVYRFEGPIDRVSAKRFVMRQVETGTILEEPGGYLIRRARVLDPVGEVDPTRRLAVRVSGRPGDDTTIDVWLERRERGPREPAGSTGGGPTVLPGGHEVTEAPPAAARHRAEQRRQTFELLQKLRSGEELTPAEKKSPLFY